jgi:hypothetical protein
MRVAGTEADMAISSMRGGWSADGGRAIGGLAGVGAGDGDDRQAEVAELAQHAVQRAWSTMEPASTVVPSPGWISQNPCAVRVAGEQA